LKKIKNEGDLFENHRIIAKFALRFEKEKLKNK